MADTIKISDGSTEIDLYLDTAPGFAQIASGMKFGLAPHENLWHSSEFADGDMLVREKLGNRRWSMKLKLDANASDDNIADQLIGLNRLTRQARRYQINEDVDKVYLEISLDGSSVSTFYEVLDIEYEAADIFEYFNRKSGDVKFGDAISLQIVTRPWGYGNTATAVTTTTIQNCTDSESGGRVHYVDLTAGDIVGDLMAPTIITMTNNDTERLDSVWIAKRDRENHNIDIILDDADATATLNPTTYTGPQYCDGQKTRIQLTTNDSWIQLIEWELEPSDIKDWGGKFLVLSCSDRDHSASIKFRVTIRLVDLTIWSQTQPVQGNGRGIMSFGIIDILPDFNRDGGRPYWGAGQELTLQVEGYTTSQPEYYRVDCLQIIPLDGLRVVEWTNYNAPQGWDTVDDGISGWIYGTDNSNGSVSGVFGALGKPIVLTPNTAQRIFFIQQDDDKDYDADRSMDVKIEYQPRTEFLLGTT